MNIDSAWTEYLDGVKPQMEAWRAEFKSEDYIELKNFGPSQMREAFHQEARDLMAACGREHDVTIASTAHSPRRLRGVARDFIAERGKVIPGTYHSPAFRSFLADLTLSTDILPVPYEPEEMLISRMTEVGQTHGWHWDDYSYAAVWIIEAPAQGAGGALEYVRNTGWDKRNPQVEEYLKTREVESRTPAAGSVYVLKANTSMHRVAPLTEPGTSRMMTCFSYAVPEEVNLNVEHETVQFWGEDR